MDLLLEANESGFIDYDMLYEYLHFREVVFDMFNLLDSDGDRQLQRFTRNLDDLSWLPGDFDDSFWDDLKIKIKLY